ncbi:hypothetical protein [Streptomyces sp. NPDC005731]|uniref:hypothetical protein n=1 Tax=Streptomyces sp. NPDC005731 TaxID=3157056 RepID=UPI0034050949
MSVPVRAVLVAGAYTGAFANVSTYCSAEVPVEPATQQASGAPMEVKVLVPAEAPMMRTPSAVAGEKSKRSGDVLPDAVAAHQLAGLFWSFQSTDRARTPSSISLAARRKPGFSRLGP